jgi:hypothetical protein
MRSVVSPHSRRYRLVGKGYSICVVFLKLFERINAPRVTQDLHDLLLAVGLKVAA